MSFLFAKRKTINLFRPRDKRFIPMNIKTETDIALNCPKKDGFHWRFYKSGPGWTGPSGEVLFLGIGASAYTAVLKNDAEVKVTLSEALKILIGDIEYNKLNPTILDVIEKHKFGVTLDPEKIPSADKEGSLTAINIDDENTDKLVGYVTKAIKEDNKMDWKTFLMGGATFAFAVYLLINLHVLPAVI